MTLVQSADNYFETYNDAVCLDFASDGLTRTRLNNERVGGIKFDSAVGGVEVGAYQPDFRKVLGESEAIFAGLVFAILIGECICTVYLPGQSQDLEGAELHLDKWEARSVGLMAVGL